MVHSSVSSASRVSWRQVAYRLFYALVRALWAAVGLGLIVGLVLTLLVQLLGGAGSMFGAPDVLGGLPVLPVAVGVSLVAFVSGVSVVTFAVLRSGRTRKRVDLGSVQAFDRFDDRWAS